MIQRLRPEDKTKAVGLLGLSVAVFAIAGFRTQTITPQNEGETSVTFVLDNAPKASSVPSSDSKPNDGSITLPESKPQSKFNPFKDPTELAPKTIPQVNTAPSAPYLPMQGEIASNTNAQDRSFEALSTQPKPEVPPQFSVCGVVTGERNMAIVQTSKGQFIVSAGDVIAHGCKVLSISNTTMKVQINDKVEFYPVGH